LNLPNSLLQLFSKVLETDCIDNMRGTYDDLARLPRRKERSRSLWARLLKSLVHEIAIDRHNSLASVDPKK
jgi:hypothetical protein